MADAMVERLDTLVVKDDIGVEFWDTMRESGKDTASKKWDAFTHVDERLANGENANSNYAILGLTEQQIAESGDSWMVPAKKLLYASWNVVTWGALKENDLLAVRHADGEITESAMKNGQYLNGGIALVYTATAGYGASARAFVPVAEVSLKMHLIGAGIGGGTSAAMQYAMNDKVDWARLR